MLMFNFTQPFQELSLEVLHLALSGAFTWSRRSLNWKIREIMWEQNITVLLWEQNVTVLVWEQNITVLIANFKIHHKEQDDAFGRRSGSWSRANVCDLIHVTQIDMTRTSFEVSTISQSNTSAQLESAYEWNWKWNQPACTPTGHWEQRKCPDVLTSLGPNWLKTKTKDGLNLTHCILNTYLLGNHCCLRDKYSEYNATLDT